MTPPTTARRSGTGTILLTILVALGMAVGIVAIFFWVPTANCLVPGAAPGQPCFDARPDYIQHIFYMHVPIAYVAYLAFGVVLVGSVAYLKTSKRRWDRLAHASAEIGVLFTGLCLVTGMLWGRPRWGTFWTWDETLTLTFVLFLIYVGYLLFRGMASDAERGARVAAVIGIVGFADVPLVHFSMVWWRTLHPAEVVINPAGPQLPTSELVTMLWMVAVYTGLYILMMLLRTRLGRAHDALADAEAAAEDRPAPPGPVGRSGAVQAGVQP
ncbi:MAG TPA: cytochrome c biogenesis protein CcsA [Actinomycetota bacterium]|nr:cytochrome c biogenesis protein CcsA [Actinomycetota bacterium]